MASLPGTARRTLIRLGMVSPGQMVLAALSGGPDSTAMLHVLAELRGELGFRLAVAHLDHGLRDDSRLDAQFAQETAGSMGLPFVVERARLKERLAGGGVNVQSAAREARYDFLERAARKLQADRIAVGHTADDQAETYLMRELRGSGTQGLSSIPPVRGKIIRPLIEAGRDEVMEYLAAGRIGYRTDPTNLKTDYLRNDIRLRLMPLLREFNPRVVQALCRSADVLREEDDLLDSLAAGELERLTAPARGQALRRGGRPAVKINLEGFGALQDAMKRRVMRLAIKRVKGDLLGVGYSHVAEAAGPIASGGTGRGIDIPGGVRVQRDYGDLLIFVPEDGAASFCEVLPVPGSVEVARLGIRVEARPLALREDVHGADAGLFDLDRLRGGLEVRSRRPGDYFYPEGMEGRKKLKDYFIDLKLPREQREKTPILSCGGEVAWVMGRRIDRRFAVGSGTRRFLLVSFGPAAKGKPR